MRRLFPTSLDANQFDTVFFLAIECTYMATTMKVKNGKIVLPRHLRPQWNDANLEIREYSANRIVFERIAPEKKQQALAALKAAAGILKGRISDPVAWQRKIRKEWDRPLPRLHVHH